MPHTFSKEETMRGALASKRSRGKVFAQIKKITGLEVEGQTIEAALKVLAVWVSTPVGQAITGLVALTALEKFGVIGSVDRDHFVGAIITAETVQAIGQSGIISQVGSLVSSFAK